MNIMQLRPHHVLDIVSSYGHDEKFKPHEYGHAVHTVALSITADIDQQVEFVVGADEICKPCKHLRPDGQCDDIVHQLNPSQSKQEYNDNLDNKLFEYLGFLVNSVMTMREYLEIVNRKVPGIERVCTHPKENPELRLKGLKQGLIKLEIRREKTDN
jgi:hypothetical protein